MRLDYLTKIDQNARRLKEIVSILAKYGLADWLQGINHPWLQNRLTSFDGQRIADLRPEVGIRLALTELGTTFIKLGQMLSTRADLVGPEIIRRYGIILPSSCSMLLKVLVMLEGTSRQLDPKFSLSEVMKPFYAKTASRRLSPQKLLHRTRRTLRDWERLIDTFPRGMADILTRVRRGNFDVNLQHRRLDATVNRLVMGILTAALFIGSSLLWSRNVQPMLWDYSVPGALGCAAAVALGIRLLQVIKRSGKIEQRQ